MIALITITLLKNKTVYNTTSPEMRGFGGLTKFCYLRFCSTV